MITVGGAAGEHARVDNYGHVFIPDRQQNIIHVFDSHGNYLTHLGNKGKGPGEFVLIMSLRMGAKYLYVYDGSLNRISLFSLDSLAYVRTINLDPKMWSHIDSLKEAYPTHIFFVTATGKMLVGFTPLIVPYPSVLQKDIKFQKQIIFNITG